MQRMQIDPLRQSRSLNERRLGLAVQLVVLLWLLSLPGFRAEVLWTYLPNPPLLHPVTWEDPRVPVYVNDTKILGLPSASHIWFQWQEGYNYSGSSMHTPICFGKNVSEYCLRLQHTTVGDGKETAAGIHWDVDYLYPLLNCTRKGIGPYPQKVKACSGKVPGNNNGVEWVTCHSNETVCNDQICDWTKLDGTCHPTGQVAGLWTGNNRTWQSELWKLTASMDYITISKANVTRCPSGSISGSGSSWNVSVSACVPEPYALLIGQLNIQRDNSTGMITLNCSSCVLSNCVNNTNEQVAILFQPSFVFLPVNLTGLWYEESGLAVLQQAQNQLIRGKRFIGLLIAGITALITMVADTAASAIALSTGIQTASFVNELAANVTRALETQQDWDQKIEQRLNALYDTVQILGDELVSLETRVSLRCHAGYRYMCVTPIVYNSTQFSWEKVKNHLNGIWHNTNTSLDLRLLHQEIQNMANAPPLDIDIAKQAKAFVDSLQVSFPSIAQWGHQIIALTLLALICCGIILLLCCCLRMGASQISQLYIQMKRLQLQQELGGGR